MIEVILDTETTGLSAEKDRIVEIACVELSNHIPTKNIFHTFLNPEIKVSADAFSVHGYSDEFLSNKPKFKDVAKDFLNFIKDKKLIIHNADFDLGFLNILKKQQTSEKSKQSYADFIIYNSSKNKVKLQVKNIIDKILLN